MLLNKILSCLIFLGGMLIVGMLYYSLGADENYDAEYKTPSLIAIAVLIPLTLFISIRVWRKTP
jgi:hypothetical protein